MTDEIAIANHLSIFLNPLLAIPILFKHYFTE